eukprot:6180860-Pleurochrysis_carterae.AAC.2
MIPSNSVCALLRARWRSCHLFEVLRVVLAVHVRHGLDAGAVRVWAVDKLRRVAQLDGVEVDADEVLAVKVVRVEGGELGVSSLLGARTLTHALDADEPPAALAQHVVAQALRGLVPIARLPKAPTAARGLVLQVDGHDVPLAAEMACERCPAL